VARFGEGDAACVADKPAASAAAARTAARAA
jgi:hypothetical protein